MANVYRYACIIIFGLALTLAPACVVDDELTTGSTERLIVDPNGFNMNGFNMNGFNMNGFNMNGFNMNGFNMNGFTWDEAGVDGSSWTGFADSDDPSRDSFRDLEFALLTNAYDFNRVDWDGYQPSDVGVWSAAAFGQDYRAVDFANVVWDLPSSLPRNSATASYFYYARFHYEGDSYGIWRFHPAIENYLVHQASNGERYLWGAGVTKVAGMPGQPFLVVDWQQGGAHPRVVLGSKGMGPSLTSVATRWIPAHSQWVTANLLSRVNLISLLVSVRSNLVPTLVQSVAENNCFFRKDTIAFGDLLGRTAPYGAFIINKPELETGIADNKWFNASAWRLFGKNLNLANDGDGMRVTPSSPVMVVRHNVPGGAASCAAEVRDTDHLGASLDCRIAANSPLGNVNAYVLGDRSSTVWTNLIDEDGNAAECGAGDDGGDVGGSGPSSNF